MHKSVNLKNNPKGFIECNGELCTQINQPSSSYDKASTKWFRF